MLDPARAGRQTIAFPFSLQSSTKPEEVVLAFDFGTRRIGVALGNSLTRHARPLEVIDAAQRTRWHAIGTLLSDWQPRRLVVGVPRHPDGADHAMTRRCEQFARQLAGRYRLPVSVVDERFTTAVLDASAADDADAAAVILQQWFDEGGAAGQDPAAHAGRASPFVSSPGGDRER